MSILIVDDDSGIRKVLELRLIAEDFSVVAAVDAKDAFGYLGIGTDGDKTNSFNRFDFNGYTYARCSRDRSLPTNKAIFGAKGYTDHIDDCQF